MTVCSAGIQLLFVADGSSVAEMTADESPANLFPCMSSGVFHQEVRAHLYALVTGQFLDEATAMESLSHSFSYDGPFIYRFNDDLVAALARLEEDRVEDLGRYWQGCAALDCLDLTDSDLHDFLFQLIHLCQIAHNDDLNVYAYADN